ILLLSKTIELTCIQSTTLSTCGGIMFKPSRTLSLIGSIGLVALVILSVVPAVRPAQGLALEAVTPQGKGSVPATAGKTAPDPAKGPLKVHPRNPRYFTDDGNRAVFLTGSHTWANLQDISYAAKPSPPTFDFPAYLAFLKEHNHNFFRLWTWESPYNP